MMMMMVVRGFADNGDYWRSYFETVDLTESIETLWRQVRPLYQQLHAYIRRKLMDAYSSQRHRFPASGHIPAHLFGQSTSDFSVSMHYLVYV